MFQKQISGVTFSFENNAIVAQNGLNTVSVVVTSSDLEALLSYVPNPDPELFDQQVINGIKEAGGTFKNLILWTDKQGKVFVSMVDHQKGRDGIWVETDPINIDDFRSWIKTFPTQ